MKTLIVNLKAYSEATGSEALKLAKICEKVGKELNVDIMIAPQTVDIRLIKEKCNIKILAQDISFEKPGPFTGHNIAESLREAGAVGALINHSENPVTIEGAAKIIERCKELDMISVFCTPSPVTIERIRKYEPDFIAYEPPELIGGNISVSAAKPKVIEDSVMRAKHIHLLVGAGVKDKKDCVKAVELGASGILVSSGVVKAENVEKKLIQLCEGLS